MIKFSILLRVKIVVDKGKMRGVFLYSYLYTINPFDYDHFHIVRRLFLTEEIGYRELLVDFGVDDSFLMIGGDTSSRLVDVDVCYSVVIACEDKLHG